MPWEQLAAPAVRPYGPLGHWDGSSSCSTSNFLHPRRMGTELSRVLNPARVPLCGRTALPRGPTQPQDAMSRHQRVPTSPSMYRWTLGGDKPVIPGVALSVERAQHFSAEPRITQPDTWACSTCQVSQSSSLVPLPLQMISNHSEGTFGRLRYL